MGTPEFAVPSLRVLLEEGHEVAAVVTQPDRPKGRKRVLTPPPVKEEALRRGIPVWQPEKLRKSDTVQAIRDVQPDLIVTAAYGQILPKAVLEAPRLGCINIHASLLPKYRGGAPIHYAVMNGDAVTGVTIMYMAEGLDTGDMIAKVEVPIEDEDTTGTMFGKLSVAGAELLRRTLPALLAGEAQAVPQNDADAVYSPNIRREQELVDWSRDARAIWNQIRGLNPFPGAYTLWNGEVLKLWASEKPAAAGAGSAAAGGAAPGTVLRVTERGVEVQTGGGSLWLTELQPAGKKAMSAADFRNGGGMAAGTVLGT
ncbi:methionyl-tRNA formyltransferase [Gordoniibacillus kamchatkensis]|uniref:Methionyl-tRNA formyltransferase n=1 Tax=Gordoniibacillus kamchatkensis TaxID=1590651 RepID=A0ABR5ALG9_9BACL|nr:methionyl-tRNA formyltransferase [Paenibacillus sp. VKM B-2647]KIL41202.1 methionyl-tRNA formyltransferase [Paenibacillus sp. VKM B-2647]